MDWLEKTHYFKVGNKDVVVKFPEEMLHRALAFLWLFFFVTSTLSGSWFALVYLLFFATSVMRIY